MGIKPKSKAGNTLEGLSNHYIGLAVFLMVLSVAALVIIPCPTEAQFFPIRLLLSLCAAAISYELPGSFQFTIPPYIKSSGALGIFLLVYMVNPRLLNSLSSCENQPFEYTVQLLVQNEHLLENGYPTPVGSKLKLRLDNTWVSGEVNDDLDADYKSIPAVFKDKKVALRFENPYWRNETDSITLVGKSCVVQAIPLQEIIYEGIVLDGESGGFVNQARVQLADYEVYTDVSGRFEFHVPVKEFKPEQLLSIRKAGYAPQHANISYRASKSISLALFKQ